MPSEWVLYKSEAIIGIQYSVKGNVDFIAIGEAFYFLQQDVVLLFG